MTDKIDYRKMNPHALAGHRAIAEKTGPRVIIFNEDGTPNRFKEPTTQERGDFLDKFTALVADMDMRTILFLMEDVDHTLSQATMQCLSIAHAVAHSEKAAKLGYDEETLCDGVMAYLDPDAQEHTHVDGGVPVSEDMLAKFFVKSGSKPN